MFGKCLRVKSSHSSYYDRSCKKIDAFFSTCFKYHKKRKMAKNFSEIIKQRRMGIYHTNDTLDEFNLCLRQMKSTDLALTLHRQVCGFMMYNKAELAEQIDQWKKMRCVLRPCNIYKMKTKNKPFKDNKFYLIVVQPPKDKEEEDSTICPLAMTLGVLVSGYSYICPSEDTVKTIQKAIGVDDKY